MREDPPLALLLPATAPIDMRHDAVLVSEADAIAPDVARAGHDDDEAGFTAGNERRRFDGGPAAREESAVAVIEEDHRDHAIDLAARRRIADHAAYHEPVAVALMPECQELERNKVLGGRMVRRVRGARLVRSVLEVRGRCDVRGCGGRSGAEREGDGGDRTTHKQADPDDRRKPRTNARGAARFEETPDRQGDRRPDGAGQSAIGFGARRG